MLRARAVGALPCGAADIGRGGSPIHIGHSDLWGADRPILANVGPEWFTEISGKRGVGMSSVVVETRHGLQARRDAILKDLGMNYAEFRALAESRCLVGNEWDAQEELEEIAFLLGEDA